MLANSKWDSYKPVPEVATLKGFLKLTDDDKHYCFKVENSLLNKQAKKK